MAEYSSNLLINPYADEPITTGWTATENAEVISSGYLGSAFRLSSPAYLEQVIPVDTFGEDTKGIQLSCRARFTNSGPALYAEIVLYLRLQITNADGTTAFFMPCQTIIMPGISTWIHFEKGFEERISGITEVVFRVYSTSENVVVDLDNISVAIDETRTESEQAFDDAVDYTNMGIEAHLNDITNSHLSDEQKYGLTGGAQRVRSIKLGMETNVRIANRNLYGQLPLVKLEAIREQTPIITPLFWTELLVKTVANVTSTSVAVQYDENGIGKVYVAYVADGTLYIRAAQFSYPISEMIWEDIEEIPGCSQCALEFDGSFVRQPDNTVIYVTETVPYLFYTTTNGALWYKKIGEVQNPLVGANTTAIDAIRGVASKYKDIDQGLLVFYVIAGSLYYRDLIDGVWGDQKSVSIAPADIVSVRAERTFDYRIVLQVTDTSGKLYEIFTKMEASGWNSAEFLALNSVKATGTLIEITRRTIENEIEAINLNDLIIDGWNMSIYSPILLSAENVEVNGDWGSRIKLTFDQCVKNAPAWPAHFKFVDGHGATWYGQTASMTEKHSRFVYVDFINFNNASNPIVITAMAGQLTNGYTALAETSVQFDAQNLVPYPTDPPVFVDMHNTDNQTIIVEFDKEIIAVLSQTGFLVYGYEPAMSPEGDLVYTEYEVDSVEKISTYEIQINLTYAGRMKHPQGEVTLHFTGAIQGEDVSFVPAFEESFEPTDLVLWFRPNDPERLELSDIIVAGQITTITYPVHEQPPEDFLKLADVLAAGVLTHIDDLPE